MSGPTCAATSIEHAVLERRREHHVGRRSAPTPTRSPTVARACASRARRGDHRGRARREVRDGATSWPSSGTGRRRAGVTLMSRTRCRRLPPRTDQSRRSRRRSRGSRRASGKSSRSASVVPDARRRRRDRSSQSANVSPAWRSAANLPDHPHDGLRTPPWPAASWPSRRTRSPCRRRGRRAASGSRARPGRAPAARGRRSRCRRCGAGRTSSCSRRC